jgi:hypothetical protein
MNDLEIVRLFDPLLARFATLDRLAKGPPLLAHYMSIRVAESILKNSEVWFSNPLFMNDLQEMRFGLNEGSRLFADTQLQKRAGGTDARAVILNHSYFHYFNEFEHSIYMCSASPSMTEIIPTAYCLCGEDTASMEMAWRWSLIRGPSQWSRHPRLSLRKFIMALMKNDVRNCRQC